MKDLHIISTQTVDMPDAPYQARHFIDGVQCDSADGAKSDRVGIGSDTVGYSSTLHGTGPPQ